LSQHFLTYFLTLALEVKSIPRKSFGDLQMWYIAALTKVNQQMSGQTQRTVNRDHLEGKEEPGTSGSCL
jgi:hypothetical protein